MALIRQSVIVSKLSLEGLRPRLWSSLVIVMGMACVTGVLVSMFSITAGLVRVLQTSADPARMIVLASRAVNEFGADLTPDLVGMILDAPGIARDTAGHAIGEGEVLINTPPPDGFSQGSFFIRGVGPQGLTLRPGLRIIAGRMFTTGRRELIVGAAAGRVFRLKVGDQIILPDGEWSIVGVFSGAGAVDSQLMADAQTLMASTRRTGYGSVLAQLTDQDRFEAFKEWLTANPALAVNGERQTDYYTRLGSQNHFYDTMAYVVGAVMSFGALFGAVNILYSTVRARTREIATLRAIGYQSLPVAISVVFESLVLSILGAAIGSLLAWALVDGHESLSFWIFRWSISPALIALGVGWTAILALLGSLFPAIRAARIPVAQALRAT